MRKIKFAEAINEAIMQAMERNQEIFVYGLGVDDPLGIFGTTKSIANKFGKERVLDVPLSENALTGIGIGAALNKMHPLFVHTRNDFMLLTMDQVINHAASWSYIFDGGKVPLTIRSIVGRGWGQAAQHSQSFQSLFAHIPGLKIIMPTTAYDAKGLLISSLEEQSPIIFIEHRWLHNISDDVPEYYYKIPLGKARILKEGKDITIVGISYMNIEAIKAIKKLEESEISIELIDLRTLKPWDKETVFNSVKKTKRLVILDIGWKTNGFPCEVSAEVNEKLFGFLKAPVARIGLPDLPTPAASSLEKEYYPNANDIIKIVCKILNKKEINFLSVEKLQEQFIGPF